MGNKVVVDLFYKRNKNPSLPAYIPVKYIDHQNELTISTRYNVPALSYLCEFKTDIRGHGTILPLDLQLEIFLNGEIEVLRYLECKCRWRALTTEAVT